MRKESSYIEVTFGNGFEFKGLTEELVPTLKAIENNLMPILKVGHTQNMELNGAIIAKQVEEHMPEVV